MNGTCITVACGTTMTRASDEQVMQVRNERVRKVDDAAATWHSCSISTSGCCHGLLRTEPQVVAMQL